MAHSSVIFSGVVVDNRSVGQFRDLILDKASIACASIEILEAPVNLPASRVRSETKILAGKLMKKIGRWWISGLLSLLKPGLGQLCNGQVRKGITLILLSFLLNTASVLFLDIKNIVPALSLFAVSLLGLYIYAVIDAVIAAKRTRGWDTSRYNTLVVYLAVISLLIAIKFIDYRAYAYIKENYVQAFKLPSSSMNPTLLMGDRIIVDMRESARNPKKGDIIVFEFPNDPAKLFIKRVVAVGGDSVLIKDKRVLINGIPEKEPFIIHTDPKILPADRSPRDNFGPATVPAGSYFVMGDNRDQSYDSQIWGFLDRDGVKGTVREIYWSWDRENLAVRWNRIGSNLRYSAGQLKQPSQLGNPENCEIW